MDPLLPNLQTKPLLPSKDEGQFRLYRAALEWELIEPIVIESKEDMRSESKWRELLEPYHHQVTNLITFCRRLPVTLIADDVGLGKTISAGLIASELISRGRISKILIVCPKIIMPQWKEELDVKFGIPAIEKTGKDLIAATPPGEAGAIITTYNSARLHFETLAKKGFDMLILDEAHKLRNLYGVQDPPQVALRFQKALADRTFRFVLMLTATPIQNRLWDIYSLVDLLAVARGHQNPFGSVGMFARKYIADSRTQARKLVPEMQEEFRSIVYQYMSRVRRGDSNLDFPKRIVELRTTDPTPEEMELINIIAEPIQELNILVQISLLQALMSSPEALSAQLNNMVRKGTIPPESVHVARDVKKVIESGFTSAKLTGLGALVDTLRKQDPDQWRVVVFTERRETQTSIQNFLEVQGISCGLINGDSGARNQETITRFTQKEPEIHVIISTRAGSEGVNLQAANVLVNYDLPWNPMIVEQRIGRIQRLASKHANVSIFNIVLKGTFEEYIVGRLMEKLQMAAHAIGDIEALLEASGMGGDGDSKSFEEQIRKLVVASLAGKDVEAAAKKAANSIAKAKKVLDREEKNINTLLGRMDNVDPGPTCPKLPSPIRSMDAQKFVLAALTSLGAKISPQASGLYFSELDGGRELICFDSEVEKSVIGSNLYSPGTASFERLVSKITIAGQHRVTDLDQNSLEKIEDMARVWVNSFGGVYKAAEIEDTERAFGGTAFMRIRATVAHDSYERLVESECSPVDHNYNTGDGINAVGDIIEDPASVGVVSSKLIEKAKLDPGILEFCGFYNERKIREVKAAGGDARKQKKLEDEFTPRLEISLVGLEGAVHRKMKIKVSYILETENEYSSVITAVPSETRIDNLPKMGKCSETGQLVPYDCLEKCEISGKKVLGHILVKSEVSDRKALIENTLVCSITGKRILIDEAETSVVSGKIGHKREFVYCTITNQPLLPAEAEKCEITGKVAMPGILQPCELTNKNVLPSELEKSAVSGKRALKKFFVSSSLSKTRLIEQEAIKSVTGKFCAPLEARKCSWSGRKCHPDDMRVCQLTGLSIYFKYFTAIGKTQLEVLVNILNGMREKSDKQELWPAIESSTSSNLGGGSYKVETAKSSPGGKNLAVCLENRSWLGLKVRQVGLLYSIPEHAVVGKIALGKRQEKIWIEDNN